MLSRFTNIKHKITRHWLVLALPCIYFIPVSGFGEADLETRLEAVNQLADQDVLATVAMEDPEWKVRRAAYDKITSPAALAKLAWRSGQK